MGVWQDIFSLITNITNSLKYFLSADSSLYLVQYEMWGVAVVEIEHHEGPNIVWRKVAVRLVCLANL